MDVCGGNLKPGVKNMGMGMFQGVEEPEEPGEQRVKGKAVADCRGAPYLRSFKSTERTS